MKGRRVDGMIGEETCPACGAELQGQTTCPICGAQVLPPLLSMSSQPVPPVPPLPRGRVALLLLNVVLLLVAISLVAWNVLAPPPGRSHLASPLTAPTATATSVATDAPVYTVSVAPPHPTSTPVGRGVPPSAPTATPRPHPTSTPAPTATPSPSPTPTSTPGLGDVR